MRALRFLPGALALAAIVATTLRARADEPPPLPPPPPPTAPPEAPPPVYRPPARQFPPGLVDVTVESDKPGAYLQALSSHPGWVAFRHRWHAHVVYGQLYTWDAVCAAPCTMRVPAGAMYRVAGPTVTPSDEFVLHPGGGATKLRVEAGSRKAHTGGVVSLAFGIPTAIVGGILILASDDTRTAGYVTGGIGAGLTLLGAILVATSATSVYDDSGRQVGKNDGVKLGPNGLRF